MKKWTALLIAAFALCLPLSASAATQLNITEETAFLTLSGDEWENPLEINADELCPGKDLTIRLEGASIPGNVNVHAHSETPVKVLFVTDEASFVEHVNFYVDHGSTCTLENNGEITFYDFQGDMADVEIVNNGVLGSIWLDSPAPETEGASPAGVKGSVSIINNGTLGHENEFGPNGSTMNSVFVNVSGEEAPVSFINKGEIIPGTTYNPGYDGKLLAASLLTSVAPGTVENPEAYLNERIEATEYDLGSCEDLLVFELWDTNNTPLFSTDK